MARTSTQQSNEDLPRTTPDFDAMIGIVKYNSVGFFFTDFVIPFTGISIGSTGLELGFLYSFLVLGSVLSALFIGYLTDHVRKKTTLILIGAIGRGASYIVMFIGTITEDMSIMMLGTFILGFVVEFFWNPFDSLVSAKSNKNNRSFAFGKRNAAIGKGQLAGGLFGVVVFILANVFVPGNAVLAFSPMIVYCACNVTGGILFTRRIDEHLTYYQYIASIDKNITQVVNGDKDHHAIDTPRDYNEPGSKVGLQRGFVIGFVMLIIAYFLSSINGSIGKPFLQLFMRKVIIDNPVLVLAAYAPAGILAQFISPRLGNYADRMRPQVGIIIFASLGALITLIEINIPILIVFSLMLVADNMFANASSLVMSNVFSRISIKSRGKVLGVASAFNNGGAFFGPIIGGMLIDSFNPAMPFFVSVFVELALIPFYLLALNRLRPYYAEMALLDDTAVIDRDNK